MEYTKYLKSGINLLSDLKGYYQKSAIREKKKLLGLTLPQNLQLSKNGSRATRINEAVRLTLAVNKGSTKKESGQLFKNIELSALVDLTSKKSNQIWELLESIFKTKPIFERYYKLKQPKKVTNFL